MNPQSLLPFLRIFYRPKDACRAAAALKISLLVPLFVLLSFASTESLLFISRWRHGATEAIGPSLWIHLGMPALALATTVVLALLGHGAAKFFNAKGNPSDLWKAVLVIAATAKILAVATTFVPYLDAALTLWKIILFGAALQALYSLSLGRAIASTFGAYLVLALGGLGITYGMYTFGLGQANLVDQFLPAPQLGGENTEADYAWSVETLDGKKVPMESFKGKPLVLNFWATWCPPCRMELPSLEKLYAATKENGVQMLAVSDEEPEIVKKFVDRFGYKLPFYVIKTDYPRVFLPRGLPTTYVISSEGKIVGSVVGAARWDDAKAIAFVKSLGKI